MQELSSLLFDLSRTVTYLRIDAKTTPKQGFFILFWWSREVLLKLLGCIKNNSSIDFLILEAAVHKILLRNG